MIYEYAIDPAIIESLVEHPDLFFTVLRQLNPANGCIVAGYPESFMAKAHKIVKDKMLAAATQEEKDALMSECFPNDPLSEEAKESGKWLELRDLMKEYMKNGESEKVFILFSDLQAELEAEDNEIGGLKR